MCGSIVHTFLFVCLSSNASFVLVFFFFFNDTATTEIYTLSLHDALPISSAYAALITLAVRLEALFGNTRQASTSNVRVPAAVRGQEINYAEIVNGAVWSHIGGLYRLETQLV